MLSHAEPSCMLSSLMSILPCPALARLLRKLAKLAVRPLAGGKGPLKVPLVPSIVGTLPADSGPWRPRGTGGASVALIAVLMPVWGSPSGTIALAPAFEDSRLDGPERI